MESGMPRLNNTERGRAEPLLLLSWMPIKLRPPNELHAFVIPAARAAFSLPLATRASHACIGARRAERPLRVNGWPRQQRLSSVPCSEFLGANEDPPGARGMREDDSRGIYLPRTRRA